MAIGVNVRINCFLLFFSSHLIGSREQQNCNLKFTLSVFALVQLATITNNITIAITTHWHHLLHQSIFVTCCPRHLLMTPFT